MDDESQDPIRAVAHEIASLRLPHPARVAVDGRTASGKTSFADAIAQTGRKTIGASIDGFHRPRAVRHRRGRFSPDGYYEDARDLDAVREFLLDPLGPGGDGRYALATFDLDRDEAIEPELRRSSADDILIVDGTFLQRPELRDAWDFVIFLNVPEAEARRRGIERDGAVMGREQAAALFDRRYGPAFARYEGECRPQEQADLLIDNSAYEKPALVRTGRLRDAR